MTNLGYEGKYAVYYSDRSDRLCYVDTRTGTIYWDSPPKPEPKVTEQKE